MPNPVEVQHISFSNAQGNTTTLTKYPLPNAVLSGNLVVIFLNVGGGNTPTSVTDDKSNVYTLGPSVDVGQKLSIYYKANVTNGPSRIDIAWSPAAPWTNIAVSEWANIATSTPTDGSTTNSGSGTAMTAGSITTGTAGDLILSAFVQTTTSTKINSFTAGSGMSLLSADVEDMLAVQYQIQVSAGAINPAMTQSPTNSWVGAVIAFKQASAGTQGGSTIRVQRIQHNSIKLGDGTSIALNFPCSGNLLAIVSNCIPGVTINAITDSNSNTWQQVPGSPASGQQGGEQQIWYVANPIVSASMTMTITKSGTGDEAWLLFDIVHASATPLGNTAKATGAVAAGTAWNGATLTPSASPGLCLIQGGVQSNTVLSLSPGTLMAAVDPNEEVSPWPRDQNNGPAMYYHSSTSPFTNAWVSDLAVGDWGDLIAEFITEPGLPILEEEGSRYRADTGDEASAPFVADQDANMTADIAINRRLRHIVDVTNNSSSAQFQLEVRLVGSSTWRKVT